MENELTPSGNRYQARLHPEQYCDEFGDADVAALHRAVRYVCDTAVAKLANSDDFPADWLFEHRWGKGKKDAPATLPNGERLTFVTVGGRTSCIVPALQKKKTPGGGAAAVEEEDAEEEEALADEPTESKFFEETQKTKKGGKGKKSNGESKADKELPPSKKAKTSRVKKTVKEEQDNDLPTPDPEKINKKGKKDVKKGADKPTPAAPALGRRRSTRLNGTG